MPVVRTSFTRLTRLVGASRKRILDRLPYVGLDIESVEGDTVRVEYSPNRPDFGTDFGVARALRGLMGIEVGLPRFKVRSSRVTVSVDPRLSKVRPFIACATATGLNLDEEDVRQIISLQEDLHNGLGRKRRMVAIGLHDLGAIEPPLRYRGVSEAFSFVPLGGGKQRRISEILSDTNEGRLYGGALGNTRLYPVITDSRGTLLSFPPVINGEKTKVSARTKDLFIDVTSTDMRAGDDVLAVLATTLAEAGATIGTVNVSYRSKPRTTPDLRPVALPLDYGLVRSVTGLDLDRRQVATCLGRSRMAVQGHKAVGPRYRVDLLHPVDIAEEVALGYGIDKMGDIYPPSSSPGNFEPFEVFLDSASTILAGAGMVELMTFELSDETTLYGNFARDKRDKITVHDPRSIEHSILRDSLLPGLMSSLAANVKSDYPQRVFEIGRVYLREGASVKEEWHIGCVVAHSQASYSEAKSLLESVCRTLAGIEPSTSPSEHWAFSAGRTASIQSGQRQIGVVGEVRPESIEAFGIRVPVSGFELDARLLRQSLK